MPIAVLFVAFVVISVIGSGSFETGLYRIWVVIQIAFFVGVAVAIFINREKIARLYYSLTPHPAKSMVEAAMERGVELDGKAFNEILRPIPGGRIEQEVRAEQAHKLAAKANQYADSMRAEADRIKAKAQREAEFTRAQHQLHDAAEAHEQAKARLDALRKWVG